MGRPNNATFISMESANITRIMGAYHIATT